MNLKITNIYYSTKIVKYFIKCFSSLYVKCIFLNKLQFKIRTTRVSTKNKNKKKYIKKLMLIFLTHRFFISFFFNPTTMLVTTSSNDDSTYNGSIFHNGFRFHRKYVGKKSCTFWCAHNRSRDSPCTFKIKINKLGVIIDQSGDHHETCITKAETSRSALGYTKDLDQQDLTINVTERMLNRAEELALNNLSMPPKKIHLKVLQEIKEKHPVFKGASNHKIINRIKNARSKLNGNDMYRTIEMDHLSKIKNSNLFFLQFNITFPNEYDGKLERILGLGNPSLFRTFGGNKRVFIGGTFKIVPKPFINALSSWYLMNKQIRLFHVFTYC